MKLNSGVIFLCPRCDKRYCIDRTYGEIDSDVTRVRGVKKICEDCKGTHLEDRSDRWRGSLEE